MTEPISKEVKEAYRRIIKSGTSVSESSYILAEWGRHERAMRLKAEFWQAHHFNRHGCLVDVVAVIVKARVVYCNDDRHSYTDEQWEQSVEEELKACSRGQDGINPHLISSQIKDKLRL